MIEWRTVDPAKLEPGFRQDVEALLQGLPDVWVVTYGRRTGAEQAALYQAFLAGGAKAAPPGHSPHEFGLAVDVVCDADADRLGVQPNWDTGTGPWQRLFAAVDAHPRLHSGRSFKDADHIERLNWMAYKDAGRQV